MPLNATTPWGREIAYMKHVVVSSGLHEADIRPPSLMSEFKKLSVEEARAYFGDRAKLVDVDCPGCGGSAKSLAFEKDTFTYNQCPGCRSVFVSPRPTEEALDDYYRNSKASRFRVANLARDTANARCAHLLRSNANWLGQRVDESGNPKARGCTDIGTSLSTFAEEFKRLGLFDTLYSLNPPSPLDSDLEAKGVKVIQAPVEGQGAVTAFEQLEHQFSPLDFMKTARAMLADGGLLFFTTRTISGFDLQMLWDKAPYIFVPEHLNLLSIDGITELVARSGLELAELSTPGQLDLELTLHAVQQDPSIELPPFIRYLLRHRGRQVHEDFQAFLQRALLSSHVRVAAAKGSAP